MLVVAFLTAPFASRAVVAWFVVAHRMRLTTPFATPDFIRLRAPMSETLAPGCDTGIRANWAFVYR
jgi:hypothetical protein